MATMIQTMHPGEKIILNLKNQRKRAPYSITFNRQNWMK
jgi:hypothetical protein